MGKKKLNKGTVAWYKNELTIYGAPEEEWKGLTKEPLIEYYNSYIDSIGGGNNGSSSQTSSPTVAEAKAAGTGAVTVAAADAGVSIDSSAKKTQKASTFLKKQTQKFQTKKARPRFVGPRRGVINISPPKKSPKRRTVNMDWTASLSPEKVSPTFRIGKKRLPSPVSPKIQEITFKNGFDKPVMLKTSLLPPSFNPRAEALSKIPGHNHPLDPGVSIMLKVRKGDTLYVHDGKKILETLTTKADPKYGNEIETRYVPTKVGNVKSNFTKGKITSLKKRGGRRRRRRRRTRRKRTRQK